MVISIEKSRLKLLNYCCWLAVGFYITQVLLLRTQKQLECKRCAVVV